MACRHYLIHTYDGPSTNVWEHPTVPLVNGLYGTGYALVGRTTAGSLVVRGPKGHCLEEVARYARRYFRPTLDVAGPYDYSDLRMA